MKLLNEKDFKFFTDKKKTSDLHNIMKDRGFTGATDGAAFICQESLHIDSAVENIRFRSLLTDNFDIAITLDKNKIKELLNTLSDIKQTIQKTTNPKTVGLSLRGGDVSFHHLDEGKQLAYTDIEYLMLKKCFGMV